MRRSKALPVDDAVDEDDRSCAMAPAKASCREEDRPGALADADGEDRGRRRSWSLLTDDLTGGRYSMEIVKASECIDNDMRQVIIMASHRRDVQSPIWR